MFPKNLYAAWLKQQERKAYEAEHGVTMRMGVPVYEFDSNGWEIRITGPWESPQRENYETDDDYQFVLDEFKPFNVDMSYYIVEDRLWCSHQFSAVNLAAAKEQAIDYAANPDNLYDPERTLIDGQWVERAQIPEALQAWSKKRKEMLEAHKRYYLRNAN